MALEAEGWGVRTFFHAQVAAMLVFTTVVAEVYVLPGYGNTARNACYVVLTIVNLAYGLYLVTLMKKQ